MKTRVKQLQETYAQETDEITRIDLLVDMAIELRNYDIEKAAELTAEILDRSRKIQYIKGEGRGYNLKGSIYWLQGDYEAGQKALQKAYKISKDVNDRRLEARVLNNYGNIFRELGDLSTALTYYESALAINEEIGNEFLQSINLTSISNLLFDLGDYESALAYALRCLPIFEKAHDDNRVTSVYNTLGNIYFKQGAYDEALKYFQEILKHSDPETSTYVLAESGVGKVYYRMNEFEKAETLLRRALDSALHIASVEGEIICHFYLGRIKLEQGQYDDAKYHLEYAFERAKEYSRKHDVMSIHEILSDLYDKIGDIPKAFHHLKTHEFLKEEIFKQTTINKLRNLQIRQQIELAQKEKQVAERTARLKQQFMANMSHEIRTPMNAIVGITRLLLEKNPREDQLRYLNAIQQSADNLLVIINDILDLSKIEAGKILIEQTDFSLHEVMQSMSDMLMIRAEEKNIAFRTFLDEAIPPRLLGDPTRLNQVLVNLAGNAVKFTEKGFVEVQAKLHKKQENTYFIQFDIIDTGIGISPDYVQKIFESFTQAGTDVARRYGGTGLGLTISKQLVTLMNGEISVESELDAGTTFTVIIPFPASDNQKAPGSSPIIDEKTLEKLRGTRLLLVEDNEFNRMVAEDTLKEALPGIDIDIAINGREAVTKVRDKSYDIVLMDIQMPVMDGVAATQAIRNELPPPINQIRIIAMTANVLQQDVQRYLDIGMNAYVAKPFQTEELLLKMAEVLAIPIAELTNVHSRPSTPEPSLPDRVTDISFLEQFSGGNKEKRNKYIEMFLINAPKLLKQIEEAFEEKDFARIKIAAHSLKPQLSYMGVREEISQVFLTEQTASEAGHSERLRPLIENLKRVCQKAFDELSNIEK